MIVLNARISRFFWKEKWMMSCCYSWRGEVHWCHYLMTMKQDCTVLVSFTITRKSATRSRAAYIWARVVEWVYKPWLLFGKCFPDERLGWLVYEIQHLPIYVHLQATACKRGRLIYGSGLSNELFSKPMYKPLSNISRAASGRGLTVLFLSYWTFLENGFD